ncbi:hypothetical protein KCTC32516_01761 [Polaribacter huanghezhanensis]|uniref:hypothetical protein n=1 Tax=Polaribacter huanghezhanensis TaxID=1354726 RepID=UPI002648FC6F|nr:hypothetical protein [Polaribacter huanghezhanensis]WKD86386.1 hypothetical protein KCTC32516_01761 [Polaribacter huanghezhanensis]
MSKDIREIMKNYKNEDVSLSANHRNKFEDRLQKEVHHQTKKKIYTWLQVAASVVLIVSLAIGYFGIEPTSKDSKPTKKISLGSLSPELKSIENYYVSTINYEISNLSVNNSNKEILEGYLAKIGELTTEYKSLTTELNTKGVNDEIINALINNLQLRLQLLQRLKKQLNDLKQLNSKQNETQKL